MTLSITSFNTTTGRVNVTLTSSNMELLLSGWFAARLHNLRKLLSEPTAQIKIQTSLDQRKETGEVVLPLSRNLI